MAFQSATKLHPTFFPTECASLGLPVFTSPSAASTTVSLVPSLSNRSLCLDGAKPTCLYSVNPPPSLRAQNVYGYCIPTYACDRRDPRVFHNAASPWEATSNAFWSHNTLGGGHCKAGVHANTPATQRSSNVLENLPSSPPARVTTQLQDHPTQDIARESRGIHTAQLSEYTNVRNTGGDVPQLPIKTISHGTQERYFLTTGAQPVCAAGSSLSKIEQDPAEHSYALSHKLVSTGLESNRDVTVRARNNAGLTSCDAGSQTTVTRVMRGPLADLPLNPGNYGSEDERELKHISSGHTAERENYANFKVFSASRTQAQGDVCPPSVRFSESRAPLQQQERATDSEFGPCGGEGQRQVQIRGTPMCQHAWQAYADSLDPFTYATRVLPDDNEKTEAKKSSSSQSEKSDGVDSRESTSSTACPSTPETRKSETSTSSNLDLDNSSSRTKQTLLGKNMRVKETRLRTHAEQCQANELAPRTVLCPANNTGRSYQFSGIHAHLRDPLLYSRHIPVPVFASASSQTTRRTSRSAVERTLQTPPPLQKAFSKSLGQAGQRTFSLPSRRHLLDKRQAEHVEGSLPQCLPSSNYQAPSFQPSNQQVFPNLPCPMVDRSTYKVQTHTASDKSGLLSAEDTIPLQHPSSVNPIHSRGPGIFAACAPLGLHHTSEVTSSRPPPAKTLEIRHMRMPIADPAGQSITSKIDQSAFLSKRRDSSYTDGTSHNVSRGYYQRKYSPAKTKDVRRNCGVLRPVFKRTVHRAQASATVGADGRAREQIRNRLVLERVASAGVTAAAATAAGTLLASSSPAIAGLAVAGVAALLTGLAAATATADTPQCYRRQHVRQAPAARYPTYPRYAIQSKQRASHRPWSLDTDCTAAWSQAAQPVRKETFQQAPQVASPILRRRGCGIATESLIPTSRTRRPRSGAVMKQLPRPELLAIKSYGTEPCTGTLMLVGRPMEAVLGLKP